jgi:hypothetical protein
MNLKLSPLSTSFKKTGFRAPSLILISFFLLVFVLYSCSTTRVVTDYDFADAVNINRDTTVYHYFWGLVKAADIRPKCDPRYNHLNMVQIQTTPLNTLVSFITLGIVIPQKLSYKCAPPNLSPGKIGN